MKTYLSAFVGAACGAIGAVAVLALLAFLLADPGADPSAAGVARAEDAPRQKADLRLENPVLRVEGDLRVVHEPGARRVDVPRAGHGQSRAAGRITLADGSDRLARAQGRGAFEPLVDDSGLIEQTIGPLTFGQLADGTLLYRGEQVLDEDGQWVRHGNWQAWHENGERNEDGAYRGGREHGPWEWWYEDGQRMSRGTFEDGQRTGQWTFWHPGGELMMHGQYDQAGLATGVWTYYHTNGKKAAEGEMVADEPEGRWTSWEESGALNMERSGIYVRGERVAR